MSTIKDIGAVKDKDGSEVRIGWAANDHKCISSTWIIYLRFSDSWWEEQEGIIVKNSEEAHEWANNRAKKDGLRSKRRGTII